MSPTFPYTAWTIAQANQIARRELTDLTARWWTDTEINRYIESWQNELQQRFEFVWSSNTLVTASSTIALSSVPNMLRLDAIYYNNYRLSGRLQQDANEIIYNWQNVYGSAVFNPEFAYQIDSQHVILWPTQTTAGTLTFEYPTALNITSGSLSLPAWTQFTLKNYVGWRAYLRLGPTNDLKRAMRYKAKFEKQCRQLREFYDHYMPERYRRLKIGGKYEHDIINPSPAIAVNPAVLATVLAFADFNTFAGNLTGNVDGVNRTFTMPLAPKQVKVFRNGSLQELNVQYTWTALTSSFTFQPGYTPQPGDLIVAVSFNG